MGIMGTCLALISLTNMGLGRPFFPPKDLAHRSCEERRTIDSTPKPSYYGLIELLRMVFLTTSFHFFNGLTLFPLLDDCNQ